MKDINIANAISKHRKAKGITQDELASYMGVSKASVSKWETGQSYPDITFLPQLAAYFNISIDELIGYEPQMVKEDIKKLYYRLANEFVNKPFEEVIEECRGVIKKYYSCFPLLMQMGILLLNHHMLEKDADKQKEILQEIIALCRHIKEESRDVWLSGQANVIEAMVQVLLQKPEEVFALLGSSVKPVIGGSLQLANAYQMSGNIMKAKEVVQIGIYQDIIGFLGTVPSFLMLYIGEPECYEEMIKRTNAVAQAFALDKLHPGVMMPYYLTAANGYVMQGKENKALDMLQKYTELCMGDIFPYTLHGDSFFDLLEDWFTEFDLGNKGPREDKTIKESMYQSVTQNPSFTVFSDNPRFKSMVEKLTNLTAE